MIDIIFSMALNGILSGWNLHSFYKKRKNYNLLFCIFFAFELLREIFGDKSLTSNIGTVIMFIQGAVFIIAVILFFHSKLVIIKKNI